MPLNCSSACWKVELAGALPGAGHDIELPTRGHLSLDDGNPTRREGRAKPPWTLLVAPVEHTCPLRSVYSRLLRKSKHGVGDVNVAGPTGWERPTEDFPNRGIQRRCRIDRSSTRSSRPHAARAGAHSALATCNYRPNRGQASARDGPSADRDRRRDWYRARRVVGNEPSTQSRAGGRTRHLQVATNGGACTQAGDSQSAAEAQSQRRMTRASMAVSQGG